MSNEKIKKEAQEKIKELQRIIDEIDRPKNIQDKIKNIQDVYDHFQIKTHGDAYRTLGLKRQNLWDMDIAYCEDSWLKIALIAKALNQGWEPNFLDSNEWKYYPWFKKNSSGSGFSDYDYDGWRAGTYVGSRLCYKTAELAEYAGRQFEAIYSEHMSM